MIRTALVLAALFSLAACNYNPRPGGWKLMLQKQPSELPPRYHIPVLDPSTPSGIRPEDQGRRMMHDSTMGTVPAPGQSH